MSEYFYQRVNRGRVDFAKVISDRSGNEVTVAIVKMKRENGFHGWSLIVPDMYVKEANDNDALIIQLKKNSQITLRKARLNKINDKKAVPFDELFYDELVVFTTDNDIVKGLADQSRVQLKSGNSVTILNQGDDYQYYIDKKGNYIINKYLHHTNEPDDSDHNKKCRKYVFSAKNKGALDYEILNEILHQDETISIIMNRKTTFKQKEDGFISFKNLYWEMKNGQLISYDLTINNQYISSFRQSNK